MAFVQRQFDTVKEIEDYLNDIALGSPIESIIRGLHNLTFIIDDGVADRTVTFADASGVGLSLGAIVAQIAAAHANLVGASEVRNYRATTPQRYQLAVVTDTYIIKDTGTANALLGYPVNPAGDVTVGAGAVVGSDIVTVKPDEAGNKFTVVHQ